MNTKITIEVQLAVIKRFISWMFKGIKASQKPALFHSILRIQLHTTKYLVLFRPGRKNPNYTCTSERNSIHKCKLPTKPRFDIEIEKKKIIMELI